MTIWQGLFAFYIPKKEKTQQSRQAIESLLFLEILKIFLNPSLTASEQGSMLYDHHKGFCFLQNQKLRKESNKVV